MMPIAVELARELLGAGHRTEDVEDAGVDRIAQRRLAVTEDL